MKADFEMWMNGIMVENEVCIHCVIKLFALQGLTVFYWIYVRDIVGKGLIVLRSKYAEGVVQLRGNSF